MTEQSDTIKVRAHHLLCMQGFQGYGYDKTFVDNMYFVLSRFDEDHELELELVAECDDICAKCPHMNDALCRREPGADEKIRAIDRLVLDKVGIEPGATVKVDEIIELVNDRFKTHSDIEPVCGDCEWKKECLFLLAKVYGM